MFDGKSDHLQLCSWGRNLVLLTRSQDISSCVCCNKIRCLCSLARSQTISGRVCGDKKIKFWWEVRLFRLPLFWHNQVFYTRPPGFTCHVCGDQNISAFPWCFPNQSVCGVTRERNTQFKLNKLSFICGFAEVLCHHVTVFFTDFF